MKGEDLIKGNINISNADSITNIISCYGLYKDGWDFGEGIAAAPKTISKAFEIYLIAKEYGRFITEPHPIEDGGIDLLFYIKNTDHFLDVEITPNCTIDYRYEIGIGSKYRLKESEKNIDIQKLTEKFNEILNSACDISESLTLRNTTGEVRGSLQEHLESTKVEYRSFPKAVPYQSQRPIVFTFQSSMAPLLQEAV
jgi:hypothetical protein